MRFLIRFTAILLILFALAAAGLVVLVQQFDLNRIKPQIQQSVYDSSQIALAIDGDIEWVFDWRGMPSVSIQISDTRAYVGIPLDAVNDTDEPLFQQPVSGKQVFGQIDAFSFGVSLGELLRGKVNANGLAIDGLQLNLHKDAQGVTNWSKIGANTSSDHSTEKPDQTQPDESTGSSFSINALVLEELRLNNIELQYRDDSNDSNQAITIESLSGENINLQADAFPISATLRLSTDANSSQKVSIDIESRLALMGLLDSDTDDNTTQQISASDINALINLQAGSADESNAAEFTLTGNATYRLNDSAIVLDEVALNSDISQLAITLNAVPVASSDPNAKALELSGNVSLAIDNIQRQLNVLGQSAIATADQQVLNNFSLNADIGGTLMTGSTTQSAGRSQVSLANIKARLDDTTITGAASANIIGSAAPTISTNLILDTINLDRYLPAPSGSTGNAASGATASSSANTESDRLPLDLLDHANVFATLAISELMLNNYQLTDVNGGLEIEGGDLEQLKIDGQFYDAAISLKTSLQRSKLSTPVLRVEQTLEGLNIEKLIAASQPADAQKNLLSGTANTESRLTMIGDSATKWTRSLSGNTKFTLTDGIYHSDNIEYRVCQAVALARNTRLQTGWPTFTALDTLTANIQWQNGVGQLSQLNSGLPNITLDGRGSIDLPAARYVAYLDATITGAIADAEDTAKGATAQTTARANSDDNPLTADPACAINEKYNDIAWPIVCRGGLASNSRADDGCAIDKQAVNQLVRSAAKKEARRAIEREVDKALGDKLDEGIKDLIKGGLEGLFK